MWDIENLETDPKLTSRKVCDSTPCILCALGPCHCFNFYLHMDFFHFFLNSNIVYMFLLIASSQSKENNNSWTFLSLKNINSAFDKVSRLSNQTWHPELDVDQIQTLPKCDPWREEPGTHWDSAPDPSEARGNCLLVSFLPRVPGAQSNFPGPTLPGKPACYLLFFSKLLLF